MNIVVNLQLSHKVRNFLTNEVSVSLLERSLLCDEMRRAVSCLLEWEAMWSSISVPKNTAMFVCLFVNGVESYCSQVTHITVSGYSWYVTFHEKECYVTNSVVLHCKVREYA